MRKASFAPLNQCVIVLHQPRDIVNIGGVVRAMKNMGFANLRLVDPPPFELTDITGIAHRSEDILATTHTYTDLPSALADMVYVVGTTGRPRSEHAIRHDARILAGELLARTAHGTIALLFGPEDTGLDNAALDRCHTTVSLPTNPAYPSLNLAQAALLLMYELRMAIAPEPTVPSHASESATVAQQEALMAATEQALHAVEFFKTANTTSIMRVLRALVYRAEPNQREVALLTAMAREVVAFFQRHNRGM